MLRMLFEKNQDILIEKIDGIENDFSGLNEFIGEGWEKVIANDPQVFNGKLLAFEKLENKKILVSESITYKYITGLRNSSYKYSGNELCALSVITILETTDNKTLIKKRNSGDWEESFELPGGFVRNYETSIFESLKNRLKEDFGENFESNIVKMEFENIFHFKEIFEMMCIIKTKVNFSSLEIKNPDVIIIDSLSEILLCGSLHKPSKRVIEFINRKEVEIQNEL